MSFTAYPTPGIIDSNNLAVGESCISRLICGTGATLVSGQVNFTYFTAQKSEPVNNLFTDCAGTAAGATPTFCAIGMYTVDSGGNLTLVGQCANDTTIWNTAFARFVRANTTPFNKVAGQRYAHAVLCITAAALPVLRGYAGTVVDTALAPQLASFIGGQANLPASVAAGSLTVVSNMQYGGVTP